LFVSNIFTISNQNYELMEKIIHMKKN